MKEVILVKVKEAATPVVTKTDTRFGVNVAHPYEQMLGHESVEFGWNFDKEGLRLRRTIPYLVLVIAIVFFIPTVAWVLGV